MLEAAARRRHLVGRHRPRIVVIVAPPARRRHLGQPIADGEENMDALWCRDATCYVTRISVLQQPGYDARIELEEHLVLPRCPGADDHAWPPRPGRD
jgi:hypothetical protein